MRGFARQQPVLAAAVVAMLLIWMTPRVFGSSVARIGGGTRIAWLLLGGLAAFEVFRLVSRGVDWLFASEAPAPKPTYSRATRLNDDPLSNPMGEPSSHGWSAAYRVVSPNSVREIPWRRRITELSGSLATAGLATGLLTTVLANVTEFFPTTALIGHFGVGTLIGAWSLLALGKLREGMPRERYIDRMLLAGTGVLVGIALFQLDNWLLIELPTDGWSQKQSLLTNASLTSLSSPQQVLAESYIAFFATLFGLRRWWWQTDSFRPHRFRVLSVCMTAIVGAIAARLWGFPLLWGTVWAASLSSVVQLAAVWAPRGRLS